MEAALAAGLKRKALRYILLALAITLLVGMALPRLQFQPGMPLPSFESGQVIVTPAANEVPVGMPVSDFVKILFLLIMAAFLANLIYRLIKGADWKELVRGFFSFMAVMVVLVGIVILILTLLPKSLSTPEAVPLPVSQPIVRAPLGPTPALLIWIVGLALVAATVLAGVWLVRSRREPPPELWELEADRARLALREGGDLKDVILRCYQQMSLALAEDQEIERADSMTTGEFVRLLTSKGVPEAPVRQLTQLFEAVRYGHWQPSRGAEQVALDSLDAILAYSRSARQAQTT